MSERKSKAGDTTKEKRGLYIELPAPVLEQVERVQAQTHRASPKNTVEWIVIDWLAAGAVRQQEQTQ